MKSNRVLKSKLIITLISLFAVVYTANSQTTYNPKAGLHAAAIGGHFKDSSDINSRLGWQIGMDIRKGNGVFFFNPGFFYRVTTADVKKLVADSGNLSQFNSTTTIQSIALPVNLGFYLTGQDAGLLRIYVHGGVVPSYILGMKSAEKFDLNPTEFNRFQLGLNAGIGIDLIFLNLDVSYETYLQDYFKAESGRNRIISFNVGFVF